MFFIIKNNYTKLVFNEYHKTKLIIFYVRIKKIYIYYIHVVIAKSTDKNSIKMCTDNIVFFIIITEISVKILSKNFKKTCRIFCHLKFLYKLKFDSFFQ